MNYAVWSFERNKRGITFISLRRKFGFPKTYAQYKLKQLCRNRKLFAPENHKPREYYPLDKRADVIV